MGTARLVCRLDQLNRTRRSKVHHVAQQRRMTLECAVFDLAPPGLKPFYFHDGPHKGLMYLLEQLYFLSNDRRWDEGRVAASQNRVGIRTAAPAEEPGYGTWMGY